MTVQSEIKNLEKVQERLMRFCQYIEKHHAERYDDLYIKLGQVIGTIEDVLNFAEDKL